MIAAVVVVGARSLAGGATVDTGTNGATVCDGGVVGVEPSLPAAPTTPTPTMTAINAVAAMIGARFAAPASPGRAGADSREETGCCSLMSNMLRLKPDRVTAFGQLAGLNDERHVEIATVSTPHDSTVAGRTPERAGRTRRRSSASACCAPSGGVAFGEQVGG